MWGGLCICPMLGYAQGDSVRWQGRTQALGKENMDLLSPKPIFSKDSLRAIGIEADRLVPLGLRADTLVSDEIDVAVSEGALEAPVQYKARDSIRFYARQQHIALYGEADISYQEINLKAAEVLVRWPIQEVDARPVFDSAGRAEGAPIFTEKGQTYNTESMRYNFSTRRAFIQGIASKQGDAYMQGKKIKITPEKDLHITGAKYSTCEHKPAHFHFRARRVKVLPGRKMLTGPFHMRVGEVPIYFIGFPFGFFPQPKKKSSGIITPRYGEERLRGFFLQGGGYYFAINDYMDLTLMGDIYSKGGFGTRASWRYLKRYKYNGSMNLRYTFASSGGGGSLSSRDYWVQWEHRPTSRRNSRFSASVNAGTSTYSQNNYESNSFNTRTEFSSNINYSKTFGGTPFNMNTSLRHRQNVERKDINLSFPELSLNMQRIYPLQRVIQKESSSLRKLGLSHSMTLRNELTNVPRDGGDPLPLTGENLKTFLRDAKNGAQHRVPIAMPLNVMRYFVLTPSFNYTEVWYLQELRHYYDPESEQVEIDTLRRFSRAGYYSISNGLSTRIYGTFIFKQGRRLQAIRHLITPNISLSYQPEFGKERYGVHRTIHTPQGPREVSKYQGFIFGSTPKEKSASMNFQINNQIEMKIRKRKDTTNTYQKVPIFENFSMGGSYNFLAEEYKLSTISLSARTRLFKGMNVSTNATLDPYVWESAGGGWRRTPEYAWKGGQGLGTLTSLSATTGFSLRPAGKGKSRGAPAASERPPIDEPIGQGPLSGTGLEPNRPVDFTVPWDLRVNYNVNMRRQGRGKPEMIQTMTLGSSITLTPKTRVSISSGYDIKNKKITQTSLNLTRDLHCWEVVASWVPFGRFTSYDVTIRAKSVILRDLKISKGKNFFDNLGRFQ